MSDELRISVILLLMLIAGGLLVLLFLKSRQKGEQASQFPWRALMGWCFIWVLERLIVETFSLGSFRWVLPLTAILLSFTWYFYVFYKLSQLKDNSGLDEKIDQLGNS
ncbi:MAG: hypothetical protein AAF927_00020 [Bacteroidota bacterium]